MKKKKSMQIQLTVLVGGILSISNIVLIFLLNYALSFVLKDIVIPIDDMTIEIYNLDNVDDFSGKLKVYGYLFAIFNIISGTLLTYILLGRFLMPLKKVSEHMDRVERQNLNESIEILSNTEEINSLILSFNHMMYKLKKSFETQKNLSSYIAHELKTPLTVLQTKIEVFRMKSYDKNEVEELLSIVLKQVVKLSNIIHKILELSHVERMELKEKIPLDILLEDLIVDFEEKVFQENIKLECTIKDFQEEETGNSKFNIIGNYTLLYQAFFNLLDNAIKYNYRGGRVELELKESLENIHIKIADTGIGVNDTERKSIFEPFFRGKDFEKLKKDGIGMGLSFSKKVFEHHRAKIMVSQNHPRGTLIEIRFPKTVREEEI
ncbi:HAMP domain-containing histidine kinase [Fusobacterium necrophorum]|uniref:histidine kinase n=1 Tax=Fusobacterium necrophorum subsp. funduliforme B35 TaxID=1226633 RepID=A0A017H7B9_9FUSO|nr:HAMP domain-containing sensor histidine kinase [Fusobacterium necrophorum]AVQ21567.1 sensor histidine kinase [Fusobacterium necrophorum subsp. funduliforme]EYD70200.1 integral membrane sensor signal transduction histidine kinase [Fusobacterium necrophorum subsp. funduliforme B35]KID49324.1 histidine kinase [Fusobacterium necrophorum subsp. funduliforme B35]MBR8722180.1 Adaptive-response sensory-kinase SasA [Fusobacterium necrophorum subsp. funduliforme]MDK4500986.1 HAMP domain-containing hi